MFKDMARPAKPIGPMVAQVSPPKGPQYPYGLCLRLDEKDLAKLGLDKPDVGDIIEFSAIAKVTNCNENESDVSTGGDGVKHCSVELQVTHLDVEGEGDPDDSNGGDY